MTFKNRITSAIATGAVLLNALAPAALADEITVTGNGAFSDSAVKVESNNTTVVDQNNDAYVTNNVSSNANTGGNSASFNTGGETKIVTGDANSHVDVSTQANMNQAVLDDCATCRPGDLQVKVDGNGAYSDNNVKVNADNFVSLSQDNNAKISNNIDANTNTGKNDASYNTGGDTYIVTGDAKSHVAVDNMANANYAKIGGNSDSSKNSSVTLSGNGAFSDSIVKLNQDSVVVLDQYNRAKVYNDVKSNANTGKNDAAFSTGGETAIVTGHANSAVDIDNSVNFNAASIDCDCVLGDLKVKIYGNGAYSYNSVKADLDNELFASQDNFAKLYNDVYSNAKTGYNDVSFSTGEADSDPLIATGNSWSATEISNEGNTNLFGEGMNLHLPGNWELNAHFDLSDLMKFFHLG